MEKIVKYCVIERLFSDSLEKDVNEKIEEGWQPFGGLIVKKHVNDSPNYSFAYIQSMIKYGENKKIIIDESKVIHKDPLMIKENKDEDENK